MRRPSPASLLAIPLLALELTGCAHAPPAAPTNLELAGETRLKNLRQLRTAGASTNPRWSFDGSRIAFQYLGPLPDQETAPLCAQVYLSRPDGSDMSLLSNGKGEATQPAFLSEVLQDPRAVFSSTFRFDENCPVEPEAEKDTVGAWWLDPATQLYTVKLDGTDVLPFEPGAPRGYNAEASVCQDGSVVLTSARDGDLELYRGKLDRHGTLTDVKRLTSAPGYDGQARFSPDCSRIVWSASRPQGKKEIEAYHELLRKHHFKAGVMEIWIANADGSGARALTRIKGTSGSPVFTADGKRVLFESAPSDGPPARRDLYLIATDGGGLERVTFSESADGTPAFSPDGKLLAFSSGRSALHPEETQVLIAEWVEPAPAAKPREPVAPAPPAAPRKKGYLGMLPDYGALQAELDSPSSKERLKGVRLAGARTASPAAKAGIRKGDVLVGISQTPIRSLEDMMRILSELRPGATVSLHILRAKEPLMLSAVVGSRD